MVQVELLSERRQDQCYKFVKRQLDSSDKGNIDSLFKKRDKFSQRKRAKTFYEPQYRSQRFYKSPLNYLTRIANEIVMKKHIQS